MEQLGKYRLVRRLAAGGMAEVFLARVEGPQGFEKRVVVKRLLPHLAGDSEHVDMFLTEARLAAWLAHPHLVQLYDLGAQGGVYYQAMEYVDGPSLWKLCKQASQQGALLPVELCARIISQACEGLAHAHELVNPHTGEPLRLVHRDVSLDNILLSRAGGVKVLDFGIAKTAQASLRTQVGVLKGKVPYMAPEYLRGQPLDARADVYALGVVLYEMVTGRRPFEAENTVQLMHSVLQEPLVDVGKLRPGLPEPLARIVRKALERNREQRYPSCRAMQGDLEEFLCRSGRPVGMLQLALLVEELLPASPVEEGPWQQPPSLALGQREPPTSEVSELSSEELEVDLLEEEPRLARPVPMGIGSRRSPSCSLRAPPRSSVMLKGRASRSQRRAARLRAGQRALSLLWVALGGLLAGAGFGAWQTMLPAERAPAQVAAQAPTPPAPEPSIIPRALASVPAPALTSISAPESAATPTARPSSAQGGEAQQPVRGRAVLRVRSNLRAYVRLNGKVVGRTPLRLAVKPGPLHVEVYGLSGRGRFNKAQHLELQPGEEQVVSFLLQPVSATLVGDVEGVRVVSVDGRPVKSGNVVVLYEGWHRLGLVHEAAQGSQGSQGSRRRRSTSGCVLQPGERLCRFSTSEG